MLIAFICARHYSFMPSVSQNTAVLSLFANSLSCCVSCIDPVECVMAGHQANIRTEQLCACHEGLQIHSFSASPHTEKVVQSS